MLHQARRERDEQGRIVATLEDYAVVYELTADLVSEGVGATVSSKIRETVEAVEAIIQDKSQSVKITVDFVNNDVVSAKLIEVAQYLSLDKSSASRRVKEAIEKGCLQNREPRPGRPMRLVLGDPLPEAVEVLPHPGRLREDN